MRLLKANRIPIRAISSLHLSEFGFNRVASIYLHKKFVFPDKVLAFLLQCSRSSPCEWLDPTQKKHVALYWKPSFDVLLWLFKVHNLLHRPFLIHRIDDNVSRCWMNWLDWSRVEPHMARKRNSCTTFITDLYLLHETPALSAVAIWRYPVLIISDDTTLFCMYGISAYVCSIYCVHVHLKSLELHM